MHSFGRCPISDSGSFREIFFGGRGGFGKVNQENAKRGSQDHHFRCVMYVCERKIERKQTVLSCLNFFCFTFLIYRLLQEHGEKPESVRSFFNEKDS